MALRWAAAAFEAATQNFRRIMGHEHLWMLRAALDDTLRDQHLAQEMRASSRRSTPQAANGTVNRRWDNFDPVPADPRAGAEWKQPLRTSALKAWT
jgi:hypothetical protein